MIIAKPWCGQRTGAFAKKVMEISAVCFQDKRPIPDASKPMSGHQHFQH
jgi:hypothetical protein